jgi:hypothetical protein
MHAHRIGFLLGFVIGFGGLFDGAICRRRRDCLDCSEASTTDRQERARNARNANEKPVETVERQLPANGRSKVEQRTPSADGLVRLAYHRNNLEFDIDEVLK